MSNAFGRFRLDLLGPFGLFAPDGRRIEITSKRGRALIAMLATGKDGARSRAWLQDMLWGSRAPSQAQASLRRELSNLRPLLNPDESDPLFETGHGRVSIDIGRIDVDFLAIERASREGGPFVAPQGQFLEGLDIAGEEGFEDWLRHHRNLAEDYAETAYPLPGHGAAPSIFAPAAATDRSNVAILPIDPPGDGQQATRVTEGLSELMSSVRWLPVVAAGPGLARHPASASLREIAAVLGVRYIIQAGVRRDADGAVLAGMLNSGSDGRMLWSRRFPLNDDEATGAALVALAGGLSSQIEIEEMRRAIALPGDRLGTTDMIWRARWHNNQYTLADSRIAEQLLERALEREPHSAEALIQLAFCRQRDVWGSRGEVSQIRDLRRLAQRAIAADGRDGRGYLVAGIAEIWLRHPQSAITLLSEAIALNPALAYAHAQLGAAHYLNGRPDLALPALEEAMRIDIGEHYTFYVEGEIAIARAMRGEFDLAVAAADRSIMRRNAYWFAHVAKIHALVGRGDLSAASDALDALIVAKPSFTPDFVDWVPFVDGEWPGRLKASLRVASTRERENSRRRA